MQMTAVKLLALSLFGRACVGVNPLSEVISLLDELSAKINKEGVAEAAAYARYVKWCDDTSKETTFDKETAEKQKEVLEAKLGELGAKIASATTKVEELGSSISSDENDLTDATAIRAKESSVFVASESELVAAIDTLSRATTILSREMSRNPAALAQLDMKSMNSVVQGLSAVLNAAAFPGQDQKRLLTLIQSQHAEENDDTEFGAPAAAVYKSHSSNILDVLEDLKETAEGQLSELRKAESNDKHNFDLLKQSLEDQIAVDSKNMDKEKANKASSRQAQAMAVKDLDRTTKDLTNAKSTLATTHSTCQQVAADHDATVAARKEEISVIAEARKVLSDTSSGAISQTYSFTQIKSASHLLRTRSDLAGSEVVDTVKRLAIAQHSAALSQLASRIKAVIRLSSSTGADKFAKVKGLISAMIARLESEAGADATEKSFCDQETSRTETKKGELEADIAKMTSKIDQASARSAQLKGEIRILQGELAALAKAQAEMSNIRSQTHTDYIQAKQDLGLGLSGVRKALTLLRDYYGGAALLQNGANQPESPELHSKSLGSGGSIINILEVVESDFAKNLAKVELVEADAQSEYEKTSQENEVTRTLKEQDVKYKTQEAQSADATVTEYGGDRDTTQTQYSAVLEYYSKLQQRCVAKAETYENRKGRRAAEIEGLKRALTILEDETAFVQRKRRGYFRGSVTA